MLDNKDLAKFLAAYIMLLFPDIGSDKQPVRHLQPMHGLLQKVQQGRGDMLVRELIKAVKTKQRPDVYW
jgi:hypothetical protein